MDEFVARLAKLVVVEDEKTALVQVGDTNSRFRVIPRVVLTLV
jgi:hypothetical protein